MNLQERIELLIKLGNYLQTDTVEWPAVKENAERQNGWFTQDFIDAAVLNITTEFLQPDKLQSFTAAYAIPSQRAAPKNIGLVMAGNIPLVGFHDWLCIFLSGHNAVVKPSSKDTLLFRHLIEKMAGWNSDIKSQTHFADMLKGCYGYIATGSNNSARYFEYYFNKYPHIIRRNRTSVAVLTGNETITDLENLADDVNLYFGLGCRNVTKLYVPAGYDFQPILEAFKKYEAFAAHNKYRNNYDYQLAILLLNNKYYMTNGFILMVENEGLFSAISQLHYEYYSGEPATVSASLRNNPDIQCIIGTGYTPFGEAQHPALSDFADGIDSMAFLLEQDTVADISHAS